MSGQTDRGLGPKGGLTRPEQDLGIRGDHEQLCEGDIGHIQYGDPDALFHRQFYPPAHSPADMDGT